jgi:hypothetical protein
MQCKHTSRVSNRLYRELTIQPARGASAAPAAFKRNVSVGNEPTASDHTISSRRRQKVDGQSGDEQELPAA